MPRYRSLLLWCTPLALAGCSPDHHAGRPEPTTVGDPAAGPRDVTPGPGGRGPDPGDPPDPGLAATPVTPTAVVAVPVAGAAPVADGSGLLVVSVDCRPGPGRSVTQLADLRIPAVELPAVRRPAATVDGQLVVGAVAPGALIPEQRVDGGCIVERAAAAGCLGAVEITAATIPSASLPGGRLPAVDVPHGPTGPAVTAAARTGRVVRSAGSRWGGGCSLALTDLVTGVDRPGVFRPPLFRPGLNRAAVDQPAVCGELSCTAAVTLPAVSLPDIEIAAVTVAAAHVDERPVDTNVWAVSGADRRAWQVAGDALFDSGSARIRPDAARALHSVAAGLAAQPATGAVRVEGHTDDVGSDEANVDLSRRRAAAVGAWLVRDRAVRADRIELIGWGGRAPATTDHSPQGRQRNRRVVVSVAAR